MAEPADAVNVIKFVRFPKLSPFKIVVVVEPGNVILFVPPITVIRLNVLAPVMMMAPAPPPVMARVLYVFPPPAKVFALAPVSVIAMVELPTFNVRPVVVARFHTVIAVEAVSVHVPFPILIVLVLLLLEINDLAVKLTLFVEKSNVPLVKVISAILRYASRKTIVPPIITKFTFPQDFPAHVMVEDDLVSKFGVCPACNVISDIKVTDP